MRLPQNLLDALKIKAQKKGIPYTRYVRLLLEYDVTHWFYSKPNPHNIYFSKPNVRRDLVSFHLPVFVSAAQIIDLKKVPRAGYRRCIIEAVGPVSAMCRLSWTDTQMSGVSSIAVVQIQYSDGRLSLGCSPSRRSAIWQSERDKVQSGVWNICNMMDQAASFCWIAWSSCTGFATPHTLRQPIDLQ